MTKTGGLMALDPGPVMAIDFGSGHFARRSDVGNLLIYKLIFIGRSISATLGNFERR